MDSRWCTLGIDIGTTSVKVIALSEAGELIAQQRQRLELISDESGKAEQDPTLVYYAVMQTLGDVLGQVKTSNYEVRQVGFSAAMHSVIPVDEAGKPLNMAITWMDTRASQEATEIWASEFGKRVYEHTGTPIHPMTMFIKLLWMKRKLPDVFSRAAKFVSLKEWIWYQWFNQWIIDQSMASTTGLYNTKSATWDDEALHLLQLDSTRLGDIVPTTFVERAGESSALKEIGLPLGALMNIGATDGVLANLGSSATDGKTMVLTIGTSCAVRVTNDEAKTNVEKRSFCYVLADNRFVLGGPSNSGGIAVEALFKNVLSGQTTTDDPSEGLGQMLRTAGIATIDDLYCLPYIAGERAPLWNPESRAAWIGIGLHHQREHLLRAVVEGVLFNAYWIASGLFQLAGVPDKIMASGHLLETDWIQQLTADMFGIEVWVGKEGDASAVGAAWLAEIASGQRTWNQVNSDNVREADFDVLYPDMEYHQRLMSKYENFLSYVNALNLVR